MGLVAKSKDEYYPSELRPAEGNGEYKKKFFVPPYDPRFPNQNQTRHCYQSYLDFHRCKKVRGEDYEACQFFKKCYQTLCPNKWIEKWDEQISENRFPGNI